MPVQAASSTAGQGSGQGGSDGVPDVIDHDEQVLATFFYHRYFTFTAGRNVTAEGLLTWQHGVNDFDLILKKDGVVVATSSGVASKPESFNETIGPGNYSVHMYLKTQAVVTDFYHVAVDFEPAD